MKTYKRKAINYNFRQRKRHVKRRVWQLYRSTYRRQYTKHGKFTFLSREYKWVSIHKYVYQKMVDVLGNYGPARASRENLNLSVPTCNFSTEMQN